MKVLVCCIGRLENRYIREFVEYYKNIGVTNICLYDNNFNGEEDFNDVIADYINEGFVILKNFRNKKYAQFSAYQDCYKTLYLEYDWTIFIDIDEYIVLNQHSNIVEFLSDERYKDYQAIHIRWKMFDDNDMLEDNGEKCMTRFTREAGSAISADKIHKHSTHVKTCLRGNLEGINIINPHAFHISCGKKYRACTADGDEHGFTDFFSEQSYDVACIHHFCTKTITEYIRKIKRGSVSRYRPYKEYVDNFFDINKPTPEKIEIVKREVGIDMSHLINTQYEIHE